LPGILSFSQAGFPGAAHLRAARGIIFRGEIAKQRDYAKLPPKIDVLRRVKPFKNVTVGGVVAPFEM